jgi:hypothetical protein
MNPGVVRDELNELSQKIKATAETLRILKRKKKLLLGYLDPHASTTPFASDGAGSSTTKEAEK